MYPRWTSWDVGAVDPKRVVAIIPIVLDAINFVSVMHHQFKSYGAWSFALSDYADMDIMSRIDHPNMVRARHPSVFGPRNLFSLHHPFLPPCSPGPPSRKCGSVLLQVCVGKRLLTNFYFHK